MGKRKDENIKENLERGDPSIVIDLGEKVFIGNIVEKKKFKAKESLHIKELKKDEKLILGIIKERKEIFQCELSKISRFSKFKVCRIVKDLENKELIKREKNGLTFLIRLRS